MPQRTARTSRSNSDSRTSPPGSANRVVKTTPHVVRDRLRQAIVKELSAQDRLFLVLAYAERMSPAEIAVTLDMAPSQVEVIRDRIVRELGELVQTS